jgi:hypothetical protein
MKWIDRLLPTDKTRNSPSEMVVSFGFFDGEKLLHKGSFHIRNGKGVSIYREHKHFVLTSAATDVQLFAGLVIEHEFELPACPVSVRFLEVVPCPDSPEQFRQVQRFNAALRMGVHQSDDWENIELDKHTLAFKCQPLH